MSHTLKNYKMKKKNQFVSSNEIVEIEQFNATQAKLLIAKLCAKEKSPIIVEVDCSPNGNLNAFNYGNGIESARLIYQLAKSFLGQDRAWLSAKIGVSKHSEFKTDFKLGESVGLWTRITPEEKEKLDWTNPFCVKNEKGITKIWHPDWRILGYKNGFSTRASIMSFIHESPSYRQKFYLPMKSPIESLKMHYRLVFFVNAEKKEYEFIGGLWIARPGFKIYLSKDAVVGLVSPLTTAYSFV